MKLALNHANVLIYSIIRTPEREKLFHWVCSLNTVEYFVFQIATKKDIVVNSLEDLSKVFIFNLQERDKQAFENYSLIE
jgi:polar amino acid transport system substrate-binding protein